MSVSYRGCWGRISALVYLTKLTTAFAMSLWLTACSLTEYTVEQGVSSSLAQHRAATLSQISYEYELTIPALKTEEIIGVASISFDWQDEELRPLILDFALPQERVSGVWVNGKAVSWQSKSDHLEIPASFLDRGSNQLSIDFVAGDEALNRLDEFMYTLFVPDRAHYSLPLFDQPDLKARVSWKITVPNDWVAVANGPKVLRERDGETLRYEFAQSEPIPSYLFAFAAGKFFSESSTVDGREFTMYHRETDREKVLANTNKIFSLHKSTLDWLETYTGIDYPFQKFDFVLIPSFQYGGMEHPGSIVYRQASLFLDDTATQRQILGRASLIAHETAHMWFGDLVTMKWFDDVWTKEVFANFMAAKIVNPEFPQVNHELRFLTAHHPAAYAVDRSEGTNQIRQPLENLQFAGTLYGAIIYQKAPIVMRQLEARIGETELRQGLREYLSTFAYSNASWPDLIEILDQRTASDLAAWSEAWVEEPGRPTINVQRVSGTNSVMISQQDPFSRDRVWPQTLNLLIGNSESTRNVSIDLGAELIEVGGVSETDFVLPNSSGLEYGLFNLDSISAQLLLSQVTDLPNALHRGASWVTLWDQLLEGHLDVSRFMDCLLLGLSNEDDELIVARLLNYLQISYFSLLDSEARQRYEQELEALLWAQANGERSLSSRSAFYASYRALAMSKAGIQRLYRIWNGEENVSGLALSEAEQIALASSLAMQGVAEGEYVLRTQRSRIKNPDRLQRFDFVRPSLSLDVDERKAFFASLQDRSNRNREAWVLEAMRNLHHPSRTPQSVEFITPSLQLLAEIQRTGDIFFPGRWLDVTLSNHNSEAAVRLVCKFLDEAADLSPRLRLKVLQSSDQLFRSAKLQNKELVPSHC